MKTGGDPNPGTPKFASELKKKFSVPRGEGSHTEVMEASFEAWRPQKKCKAFLKFLLIRNLDLGLDLLHLFYSTLLSSPYSSRVLSLTCVKIIPLLSF